MGALYVDGGMEAVIHVYMPILAPFMAYMCALHHLVVNDAKERFVMDTEKSRRVRPNFIRENKK